MCVNSALSLELLTTFQENYKRDAVNKLSANAVIVNGITNCVQNTSFRTDQIFDFSISLPNNKVTNQKESGRCWIFAALNCMRFEMIQKWKIPDFELSQNYLYFYDKLEKANYFLEYIIAVLGGGGDEGTRMRLLSSPVPDSGNWTMFVNLVNKYGIVPKTEMPETAVSSSTAELNRYLSERLREYACAICKRYDEGGNSAELKKFKNEMLACVYNILCICLGCPPERFTFIQKTSGGDLLKETEITPLEFYKKYSPLKPDDFVCVINAPTAKKPFHRSFYVENSGNVAEGMPTKFLNLPITEIKPLLIAQLKDGHPIWIGCDVRNYNCRERGIFDMALYDFDSLFGPGLPMDKGNRLDYGSYYSAHAMVLRGVHFEGGDTVRWYVENSAGDEYGRNGYGSMTDEWFDNYVYHFVLNRSRLSDAMLAEYDAPSIELPLWDPIALLA